MWLSTRFKFREGDDDWADYQRFIQLPQLKEVRSLDAALNKYVDHCGSCELSSLARLSSARGALPPVVSEAQYLLLVMDAEKEQLPADAAGCRLLGHDLSDETRTSSLLNCGSWTGRLAPFVGRLNGYGLLSHDDAIAAKALLPAEWPGDPHAEVTVWALYEVAASAFLPGSLPSR